MLSTFRCLKLEIIFLIYLIPTGPISAQIQCWNDGTGLTPLNDLGTAYYHDIQGGLYLGGSNEMPALHKKKGNNLSKQFKPLDSLGNIDFEHGQLLMLAFGASIASNAINAFGDSLVTYDFAGMNNCLEIKSMCFGGKDLDYMIDTITGSYWNSVRERMHDRGDSYLQVQIAWIMQQSDGDSTLDFEAYYNSVSAKYVTLMHMLKDTFPNLKQIYVSGLHYTGYMDPNHERYPSFSSPHDYWGNIVLRDLITRQINGDPALRYKGTNPPCAWMAWGPYFWADGINPRITDGLSWKCEQFRSDPTGGGFHLKNEPLSLGVEAHMLLDFFETNPVTKTWYLDGPLWAACPEDTMKKGLMHTTQNSIEVFPNPTHNYLSLKLPFQSQETYEISILNTVGSIVEQQQYVVNSTNGITIPIEVPAGFYIVKLKSKTNQLSGEFIVN